MDVKKSTQQKKNSYKIVESTSVNTIIRIRKKLMQKPGPTTTNEKIKQRHQEISKRRKSGIYRITNPAGHMYVGQSKDIYKRWDSYKRRGCSAQIKLQRSFKKYGFNSHVFDIIEECDVVNLNDREIFWGLHFNVLSEFNLTLKLGEQNIIVSDETKEKIRNTLTGRTTQPCSPETRKKISDAHIGMRHTPATKEKMKMSNKGHNQIKILQYDLSGDFIKEWNSITEARLFYGFSISACLQGKCKTAHGFIWRFKKTEIISNKIEVDKTIRKSNSIRIVQYTLSGDFVKEWQSTISASRETGIYVNRIIDTLKNRRENCGQFIWKYL